MVSAAVVTNPSFGVGKRMDIQREIIRTRDYITLGRLTAVLFEAQRDISGLSQSRPRYTNSAQAKPGAIPDSMKPFSEKQNVLWQSTTLDWLDGKRGPTVARSRDRKDLLLPQGLTPLPPIPDPCFVPTHALSVCPKGSDGCSGCMAPRIPQKLTGCPIVGDRVTHKITERDGHVWGILHPILALSVVVFGPDGLGHFTNIRCGLDQSEHTHMALLLDDDLNAFFVGGSFA